MKRTVLLAGIALALVLVIVMAWTQQAAATGPLTQTDFPTEQDPGPPVYTRIEPFPPHVYSDGQWAAIVFYREPGCVPAGFNLLLLIDPNSFGCAMTIHGTHFWEGEPYAVIPPYMATLSGDGAVPVWFVPTSVMEPALQDGVLTIGELASLSGLVTGYASHFNEMVQPMPLPGEPGGNPNPKKSLSAHGQLTDGRTFNLHTTSVGANIKTVQIHFQ